jgi:hypothetical protein
MQPKNKIKKWFALTAFRWAPTNANPAIPELVGNVHSGKLRGLKCSTCDVSFTCKLSTSTISSRANIGDFWQHPENANPVSDILVIA